MTQLGLFEACTQCRRGYQRRDSTHAPGCPQRWLTFGETMDELPREKQQSFYELTGASVSFDEWLAGLYRGRTRKSA